MSNPYRTLFLGTLVQESFLSVGGSDDSYTTVDSPFCRDGAQRPTLRGTGLAGALVAILRRLKGAVPATISGSGDGRQPSVWRFFNSHPEIPAHPAYRQHVAIDPRTGAAATGALFNVETLPPQTRWPFLLEVDTSRDPEADGLAREALAHWVAGRCLLGREVARGLGWLRLEGLREYPLTTGQLDAWPDARKAGDYAGYIRDCFGALAREVPEAELGLPGWIELTGTLGAGPRGDGYGIDSLSIGGHASEELAAAWDARFLAPDGLDAAAAKDGFDPDFAIVTWERAGQRQPYIPGSSLRGPLRHALARRLKARKLDGGLLESLFGTVECSAKLLIRDALPVEGGDFRLAWMQHHAEDEFTAGAYGSAKFDRVALMEGRFGWKIVLEDPTTEEKQALAEVLALAQDGQVGIGGGQWRGHGWLPWESDDWHKLTPEEDHA
jgi:CRISPR/Cas system CSM-associated protein Csm3 (group 7 of RAMP superfamily)